MGASRKRNGERATLSFIAATPGHGLQCLKEVDELSLMKRAISPGIECPNKAPAIRDKAIHRVANTRMRVSAGINAIVLSKTSDVTDVWYIRSHTLEANYTPRLVAHQTGGLFEGNAVRTS